MDAETATKHIEERQDGDPVSEPYSQKDEADGRGPVVKATAFDVMLSGDSRVWEVIANRKKRQVKQIGKSPPSGGPTVGRRRKENKTAGNNDEMSSQKAGERSEQPQFSIGTGFEMPAEDPTPIPEKDSLMEALNALDNDEKELNSAETEEIIFFDTGSDVVVKASSQMEPAASSNKDEPTGGNETPVTANSANDLLEDIDNDDLADMDALLASVEDDIEGVDLEGFDDNDDLGLDDFENMLNS